MPQPQLGKMQLLNLRDLWKHEERDFTPWLAEHIEDLSALLQLPIVVDQIEHKVGIYELDMLGHVEESDAIVIIENQLQATDHSHLGQLITYAAGLEAAIVVWIAPEVQDEHRAAVEWLNKHTGDKVSMAQGSRMRVEIYCATDPEKQLFHTLYGRKDEIEQQLCEDAVSWEPLEGASASRVAVYRVYDKNQAAMDTPQRSELFAWIAKNLTILRGIAKQHLVARL